MSVVLDVGLNRPWDFSAIGFAPSWSCSSPYSFTKPRVDRIPVEVVSIQLTKMVSFMYDSWE